MGFEPSGTQRFVVPSGVERETLKVYLEQNVVAEQPVLVFTRFC